MPELQRNILNFGYRINLKYEGLLLHSFDRFYVVVNLFCLPSMTLGFHQLILLQIVVI